MRFVLTAVLLSVSLPAMAQEATPAEKPKEEKQICRRLAVTGSNFGKRECHTKAEWAQINAANEANAERALEKRRASAPTSAM